MEFDDNVIAIIRKQDRTVSAANQSFFDSLPATEQRVFAALSKHVQKFSSDGERFVFDDGNVLLTNQVERIILEAIQGSTYPKDVNGFLRNFETLKQFNFDIHRDINDLSPDELGELINPIQRATVEQTLQSLTGSGVSSNFIEPVRTGIYQNIVAGSTKADLEAYLRRYILGTPEVDGLFSRYVKQVSRDALNQFDGQVNAKIANEFGLDAYRYVGSLIEDSRPQCRRWVAMGVIQSKDLPAEIAWMNANGTGAIPGTSPETFSIYRGGYNCRHSAIPFKLTKSQREKLNLPEEQQKIEKKATEANANLEAPPAASDFKDFYNYKSDLTPEPLRDNPKIPQQLFDLSENGEYKRNNKPGSDGAWYDTWEKAVVIGNGKRWDNQNNLAKVVVHEYGHRAHFQKKYFYSDNLKTNNQEHEKSFLDSEEIFKKKLKSGFNNDWQKIREKYYEELKNDYSRAEITELIGAYADTIQSISKAKYGWGHSSTYMKNLSNRRMEWFAHASENYWLGNPVFKNEFPELHDQMLEYYRELVIKPNFPKETLNF
jgi:hypothetical protein